MPPLYNSSSSSNRDLTLGFCAAATTTAIAVYYHYYMEEEEKKDIPQHLQQAWNEVKECVRKKITTVIKSQQQQTCSSSFIMKPIGTVRSIYQLCVGTPRQGLLASHTRGRIELVSNDPWVEGLQGYSHIWVIFVFHLNTSSSSKKKTPAKIAPPALGGEKVGVLATRSPHRPNPIGMTLCKLESITTNQKKKTVLHLSGLDLVDGTPVLDIKPFVSTYDSVASSTVPSWVTSGLRTKRRVIVRPEARYELQQILNSSSKPMEFYGQTGESTAEALESILLCIEEVLAVDVRSSWQTKKVRKRQSQAERASRLGGTTPEQHSSGNDYCTQQLDQLLLSYTVEVPTSPLKSTASRGSGAEDIVTVHSIELLTEKQQHTAETQSTIKEEDEKEEEQTKTFWESAIPQAVTNLFSPSAQNNRVSEQRTDDEFVDPKEPVVANTTQREIFHSPAIAENVGHNSSMATSNNNPKPSSTPCFLSPDVFEMTSPMVQAPTTPPSPMPSPTTLKITTKPPEDEDYHVLKDYWRQAAEVNTPSGLIPTDEYYKKTGLTANGRTSSNGQLMNQLEAAELSDISNSFDEEDHDGPSQPPKITREKQQNVDDDDEPVMIP